jgi:spore coat-associated protein N
LKKLNAGLMIAIVQMAIGVLLVGGTSIAFFSDTAEQHANTFSSGKLIVSLNNNHDNQFIDISNLQPGESGSSTFTISNPGTLDFSYQIEIHPSGTLTEGAHPLSITLQDSQGNQLPLNAKRNLSPGQEETLEVIWQLPIDAGNEYQGASAHLSLYVRASQFVSMNARSK